ncbi:hypothetical protein FRC11_008958, partial [Ceratobasidium sp. 423]
MPGAGPSNTWPQLARRLDEDEPFQFFDDEWDGNVPIDSDSDDGRPKGPTLAAGAAWIEGLTAAGTLSQELEAEITCTGGQKLIDEDMKTIWGFNYKVDTDMSARVYDKLPWAFPDELGNLPKHHALRTRIARLSGIKGVHIDCCVNSCMAFMGPFAILDYCLYCEQDRYHPRNNPNALPSPRKFFQYLPLIPQLINMYRHPETTDVLSYYELEDLARGVPVFDSHHNRPFVLHAYLITCFGDMPAVAKLMYMKGHNGKHPCHACRIGGVRNPDRTPGEDHKMNYTPLSRPFTTGRHEPRQIDPLNLPHCNHTEFIIQANLVKTAQNDAEADQQAQHYGINMVSPLSRLSSLDFPSSFPHDFMHTVFENVIPLLIDLWTCSRKFATFGSGTKDYILNPDIWQSVGIACVESGGMIPAIFGCQVPNIALDHSQSTAKSTLLFATLLAPALLHGRFKSRQYYDHFIELVSLIDTCMALELRQTEIPTICKQFANWVTKFKWLYYRHTPNRLHVCTLPIHSLLHIADDIEAMGPVWCYWAFPMEWFCGALGRTNLNPCFPFVSMDWRVLEVAQLVQIKYMYNLFETLDLGDCKHVTARGESYPKYPHAIFVQPSRVITVNAPLTKQLGVYIGDMYGVDPKTTVSQIKGRWLSAWGKMQQTANKDGLEMITGHALMPGTETPHCNTTFVKHVVEGALAFGRVEYFLVLEANFIVRLITANEEDSANDGDEGSPLAKTLAVAVISPIPAFKCLKDCNLITYELP